MSTPASVASATVYVPGSIGNVGPGFDVLGLAVEGLGDRITVELTDGPSLIDRISGRDATSVPRVPEENCAAIAALSLLRRIGDPRNVRVSFDRSLPISGGLGASAAASVGGAMAATLASGKTVGVAVILAAALDGEAAVAGRHLDNIAPSLFGGLTVVRAVEPPDVIRVPVKGEWWVAVVSPALRLSTKKSRGVLPQLVPQADFVQQMANTAGLVLAFATGNHDLAARSLVDLYAEPRRAGLIGSFHDVKKAALAGGALGCTISGAGPSVFALCADEAKARSAGAGMQEAFWPVDATVHVGRLAERGAYQV